MEGFDDAFGGPAAAEDSFAPPPLDDAFGAADEVDPAAEFLAQEQEDLAGLGEVSTLKTCIINVAVDRSTVRRPRNP